MILMPWETDLITLTLAVAIFAGGFVLALAMGVVQVHREVKGEENRSSVPKNDAEEAALAALMMVEQTHDKFFQAFRALADEDRVAIKGAQIAHICDRLWEAREQVEDAWIVAGGNKIVSPADRETRAYTRKLIEMVEDLDTVIVANPNFDLKPEPTRH